jgi:hypothetical protein
MKKTSAQWCREYREKYKDNDKYRLNRLLQQARVRAKKNDLICDLTIDDLLDIFPKDKICPVLNIPLFWGSSGKSNRNNSPSLDRFDPKGNYTKSNVQIISWRANMLKSDATFEEIEAIYKFMKA